MSNNVSNIVDVTITTESGAVAVKSFGIPCYVNESGLASDATSFFRSRSYGSLDEVAVDFVAGTNVHKFATKLFSAKVSPKEMAVGQTATDDASLEASLDAIKGDLNGFYCFAVSTNTLADAETIAEWSEVSKTLFIYAETALGDIGGAGDGLGKYVKEKGRERTAVFYHADAETEELEGAFIGAFISLPIGSYTVKFKDAIGVTPSKLSTTEENATRLLNVNTFVDKGGFRLIQEGTTGATFIDEVIADDWIEARIKEAVLSLFKKKPKVAYDDNGIGLVDNAIREVFNDAISRGIVTEHAFNEDGERTGGYEVTSPKASEIPSTEKETRVYSRTTFKYYKSVAMHKAVINGVALY